MSGHQGRVLLEQAITEWAAGHDLAPAMLASYAAEALRTLSPPHAVISTQKIAVTLAGAPGGCVTIGALVDYFEQVGQHRAPGTIATTVGAAPVGAVLVERGWIAVPLGEAAKRAAFAAGFAISTNGPAVTSQTINASAAARHEDPRPLPSGNEPGYLKMRQAQQRREGERSAAEQLDAERVGRLRAEQEVAELRAMLAVSEAAKQQLQEENQQLSEELKAEIRERRRAEADSEYFQGQLEDTFVFRECLRADNPTSSPELRLAFQCWRAITRDATHNPSDRGGRGVHGLVDDWVASTGQQFNDEQLKRLRAVVSWRKRGSGAIRSA